ncbi:MAG: von Willebrand factor type A domain-containing protein [Candidatus Latescibacteria bacterium]|nr:von Willebrand factor type A domain-containing protein [Candidatus Latescibacterota bacterium]
MRITTWVIAMMTGILFAALSSAEGAGRITGRVLDAVTQIPVIGATVTVEGTRLLARTTTDGAFVIPNVPAGSYTVRVEAAGLTTAKQRITVVTGRTATVDFQMARLRELSSEAESATPLAGAPAAREQRAVKDAAKFSLATPGRTEIQCLTPPMSWPSPGFESYEVIEENGWFEARERPLSTFSVDVDAASYGNVRRFITRGQLPPTDAVRIEELVNYFDYDYPNPRGRHPFSITTEVAECPWNGDNMLVHIGLQGARIDVDELPPSNLVFLIDVSGSMDQPNKLPLLKSSFRMLVDQLREQDRVAIVVYAGAAGLVLPPTSGSDKEEILCALERLQAGGSTAGGAGLQLAYQVAQGSFFEDGNNRIILATDGDFNVGMSSDGDMVRLIEEKRKTGVFLTVLGFGEGNLKDSKMEKIADHGDGHYAYIDNLNEARKVLVNEMGAAVLTIAKDVKLQVEFNPARVSSYRLIGYENRVLNDRDFDDDTKDAGEIGAGHAVTALYELTLTVQQGRSGKPLKYSHLTVKDDARRSAELLTVSFRYKQPTASESNLLSVVVKDRNTSFANASHDFRFSAAVAEYGMILRDSRERGHATMEHVIATARSARGEDVHGYRAEFVTLAEMTERLMTPSVGLR